MKAYNFSNMRGGWYIGDFYPNVVPWKNGEISVKHFPKRHIEVSYCHEKAIKFYVVLEGKMEIGGRLLEKGDTAKIDAGEDYPLTAIEDTVALLVVVGSRESSRFKIKSLDHMLSIYDSIYKHAPYQGSIDFSEISVIIQGAVEQEITPLCIESVRRFLPGSKIILSSWKDTDISNLDIDDVVLSEDPGGCRYRIKTYNKEFTNNVNRQLVSIQNGLKRVKTKYALKIRTDMILTTNEFLNWYDKFPQKSESYKLFKEKVLIADFYTRHTLRCEGGFIPTPFHASDWFFFGLTEDLNTYFADTKKMTQEEQVDFKDIKNPELKRKFDYCWNWRFPPEQFYAISALERNFPDIKMNDWSDWDDETLRKSEQFIMNNFIILDFSRHGLCLPKYEMNITSNNGDMRYYEKGLYTFNIYRKLYGYMFLGEEDFSGWDESPEDDKSFWMFRGGYNYDKHNSI